MRRLATAALVLALASAAAAKDKPFSVVEASIGDLQAAQRAHKVTSRELVQASLARIATYDARLHAVITVNPRALDEADALDRERAAGRVRGPLHGIPIAVKDNILTADLATTGGALAFVGLVPSSDATLVRNLREGGAIIIAKTQMTELANWVAGNPPMPANYNAVTGFAYNPYDPRRDPRPTGDGRPALFTGGSSSGAGTAASFWAASVGTETIGSILSPSSANLLAAVKPTVGRISRHGVIPITADQDTPGPMARSVTDAAILLGVLEGAAADPADPATRRCRGAGASAAAPDYSVFLKRDGLRGARIGVPRALFIDKVTPPGAKEPVGGLNPAQAKLMDEALAILAREGAVLVDPADIPSVVDPDPAHNLLKWGVCGDLDEVKGRECSIVLAYGMQRDFNAWLASLGPAAPVKTLTELRAWNEAHKGAGAIRFGQSLLDVSDGLDLALYRERYQADRARDLELTATHGIDEVVNRHHLDALVFLGPSSARLGGLSGYPTVIVPLGLVPNAPTPPFPDGFNARPGPTGLSFTGTACSEPTLLRLGYAFEQAARRRVPPPDLP
jgi:amidase